MQTDQVQQLSCTEAGKELFSEDEDLEELLMEITEEEQEGETDEDTVGTDELLMIL